MTELGEFGMYLAAGSMGVCFIIALSPLFKALARRIEGPSAPSPELRVIEARLAAIEAHALTSGEVDNQFVRIAELEERLDFAERLLTQRPDASQSSVDRAS